MKFLTMFKWNDMYLTLPHSVTRQMFVEISEVMKRHKEEGKATEAHFIISGKRWLAIYECESTAELWKYFNELPAAGYVDIEVCPLFGLDEAVNTVLENMDSSDPLFPGSNVK